MSKIENAESIIRVLIFEVAVKAAIASAISALPILGLPIIRQLFTLIVEKMAMLVFKELSRFVVFSIIDLKNESDLREYENALGQLKTVLNTPAEHYDHGEEGENAKQLELQKAKDEYKKRLASLIRFDS